MLEILVQFSPDHDEIQDRRLHPPDIYGNLLRRIRSDCGISQAALSARAGLSTSFVSHCENGASTSSIRTAGRICKTLGVPLHILCESAVWLDLLRTGTARADVDLSPDSMP